MFHCDVMNLAKHTKQTAVPKAPICGTGQLSSYVSASSLTNDIEALSNKRVKAVSCLSDKNVQISLASAIDAIIRCVRCNRKIMIAGNGGSASQSQHFCSELMGRYKDSRLPIRAVSLCSDVSLLTCVANDFGYERIFSRQIEGIGDAEDLFIAFTTSGKSRNILEALCECKSRGVQSLVLTGNHHDAISKLADIVISVPVDDPAIVQEIHL